jgi:carboxyl-terminal processing protease
MRALTSEHPGDRLPPLALAGSALLEGRFGYVSLPGMLGTASTRQTEYADAIQRALAAQDTAGACGWIVDLREDTGGNCYPMLAGLGPLLGAETCGFFERPSGPRSPWRYASGCFFVTAGGADTSRARSTLDVRLCHGHAPVAVLIGPHTASSGEVAATAFRGRPATRFLGQATAGFATGNRLVKLSDGAALNVTTSAFVDRTGRRVELLLLPDEFLPPDPVESALTDATVRAALAWLRAQVGCAAR